MGGREQAVMLHSAYQPHVAYGDTVACNYNDKNYTIEQKNIYLL